MKKIKEQKKDYKRELSVVEAAFEKGDETPAPSLKVRGVTIINGKEYAILDI